MAAETMIKRHIWRFLTSTYIERGSTMKETEKIVKSVYIQL